MKIDIDEHFGLQALIWIGCFETDFHGARGGVELGLNVVDASGERSSRLRRQANDRGLAHTNLVDIGFIDVRHDPDPAQVGDGVKLRLRRDLLTGKGIARDDESGCGRVKNDRVDWLAGFLDFFDLRGTQVP